MVDLSTFGLDVGIYGRLATPGPIMTLAQLAEEMGFSSVWVADHVAFPVSFASKYPYAKEGDFPTKLDDPLMEPIAILGVLAGATKRVRLGTAVLVMAYRNPVLQARQLVLDVLPRLQARAAHQHLRRQARDAPGPAQTVLVAVVQADQRVD